MRERTRLSALAILAAIALSSLIGWSVYEWDGDFGGPARIWVDGPPPELAQDDVRRDVDAAAQDAPAADAQREGLEGAAPSDRPRPSRRDDDSEGLGPGYDVRYDVPEVAVGRLRFVVRSGEDLSGTPIPPAWLWFESTRAGVWQGGTPLVAQLGRYANGEWTFEVERVEGRDTRCHWSIGLGREPRFPHAARGDFGMSTNRFAGGTGVGGTLCTVDLAALGRRVEVTVYGDSGKMRQHELTAPALWGDLDQECMPVDWSRRFVAVKSEPSDRRGGRGRDTRSLGATRYIDLDAFLDSSGGRPPLVYEAGDEDFWGDVEETIAVIGRRPIFDCRVLDTNEEPGAAGASDEQAYTLEVVFGPRTAFLPLTLVRNVKLTRLPPEVSELHVVGYGRPLTEGDPACWRASAPIEHDGTGGGSAVLRIDRLDAAIPERVMLWCEGRQPLFLDGSEFLLGEGSIEMPFARGSGGIVVGRFRRTVAPTPAAGELVTPASGFRVSARGDRFVAEPVMQGSRALEGGRLSELGWLEVAYSDPLRTGEPFAPFAPSAVVLVPPDLPVIDGVASAIEHEFTDAGPGVVELAIVERVLASER